MLENGELIGIVSDIIEQAQEQTIGHAASRDLDRPKDGFLALIPIQAGDEKLTLINGVCQPWKLTALPPGNPTAS